MNRRDFLCLRTERSRRVAHLSCERLYMHYQHATLTTDGPGVKTHGDTPPLLELGDDEPPAVLTPRSTRQLLADIGRDVESADAVRVIDTSWLLLIRLIQDDTICCGQVLIGN